MVNLDNMSSNQRQNKEQRLPSRPSIDKNDPKPNVQATVTPRKSLRSRIQLPGLKLKTTRSYDVSESLPAEVDNDVKRRQINKTQVN